MSKSAFIFMKLMPIIVSIILMGLFVAIGLIDYQFGIVLCFCVAWTDFIGPVIQKWLEKKSAIRKVSPSAQASTMFFPSSKIIIRHPSDANKILLIRRYVRGAVYYEPAGGKVEIDFENRVAESLEECAIREAKEELGLTVGIDGYLGSYYFFWVIAPHRCSSCAVFMGKILDRDLTFSVNVDSCELALEPVWVTLDEIMEKRIPIDPLYVGLESVLMNCCHQIKVLNRSAD